MRGVILPLFVTGLAALINGNAVVQPLTYPGTSPAIRNASSSLVAVSFGTLDNVKFSDPSLVQTAGYIFDPNDIASDESWSWYKQKGMWYSCLLDMSDENAGKGLEDKRTPPSAEAVWRGDLQDELRTWGWVQARYEALVSCDFRDDPSLQTKNKIGTALSALGLNPLPAPAGPNECYSIEHFDENLRDDDEEVPLDEQEYVANGLLYPRTGAYYRFAMNKVGGAIFAQNLLKPESAAEEVLEEILPEDMLPQLSRASDVMWGYWVRNNPNVKILKYWFVNHVTNEITLPLISRALKNHGLNKVPYWPGIELEMQSEEAKAILGSPMGSTMAHFLLQHKSDLGIKNVGSITIFRDNSPETDSPDTQLLFKIMDVPQDEIDDSDFEMEDAPDMMLKRALWLQPTSKNIVREHRVVMG